MSTKPDSSLHWLGKYLSLGLVLPSSAFAGYLLGSFADNHFHFPILRPLGLLLGVAGGLINIFRELLRDEKRPQKESLSK